MIKLYTLLVNVLQSFRRFACSLLGLLLIKCCYIKGDELLLGRLRNNLVWQVYRPTKALISKSAGKVIIFAICKVSS